MTPGAVDRHAAGRVTTLLRHGVAVAIHTVRLSARLRRLRPDVVHANSLKSGLIGGVASRLARVPMVWHLRDQLADDYLPAALGAPRAMGRPAPAGGGDRPFPCRARRARPGGAAVGGTDGDPRPVPRRPRSPTGDLQQVARGADGREDGEVEGTGRVPARLRPGLPRRRRARHVDRHIGVRRRRRPVRPRGRRARQRAADWGRASACSASGTTSTGGWPPPTSSCTRPERPSRSVRWWWRAWPPAPRSWPRSGAGPPSSCTTVSTDSSCPRTTLPALAAALRRLAADPSERHRLGEAARERIAAYTDPDAVAAAVQGVHERAAARRTR